MPAFHEYQSGWLSRCARLSVSVCHFRLSFPLSRAFSIRSVHTKRESRPSVGAPRQPSRFSPACVAPSGTWAGCCVPVVFVTVLSFLPPLAPRSLPASSLLRGLCRLPQSLPAAAILTYPMKPSDHIHPKHPRDLPTKTVSSRLLSSLRARIAPRTSHESPGVSTGRTLLSACSSVHLAVSGSLAFGSGLSSRIAPHQASRLRSCPRLPAGCTLPAVSDFHWLVSWFHQRTVGGLPSPP